jgi:hypothetical protein
MNTKGIGIIVILIALVAVGGFYLGQTYKLVPTTQTEVMPTNPPAAGLEETPFPVVTSTPFPTQIPIIDDKAALVAMVKASEVARIGADANASTYTVSQIQGNYARGMASASGGGAIWFAAKVNGTWKLVFIGNGTVQCSQLVNYPNFPNTMIPECWDAVNQKNVTR